MYFPQNVYLADDDCDDADFFREALYEICPGCNLSVFCNGEELLDGLMSGIAGPDIIFIDVNMPKMDGITALQAIKNLPLAQSVPIIIYSTSANETHIAKAMEYGASQYLVKPSNFIKLRDNIKVMLETGRELVSRIQPEHFVIKA